MNEPFITDDFLLDCSEAGELYRGFAAQEPIIDYHNHLPPEEIAQNHHFETITEAWLEHDHYKWRAMRACGIDENLITGDATPREKFDAWAETVPRLLGNPLYHWTHLELARYFGIDELLSPDTADAIWNECNKKLESLSCRDMLEMMNVRLLCTTDDPADTLDHHRAIAQDADCNIRVLPAWRPDKALAIESPAAFRQWLDRLSTISATPIESFEDFWAALQKRHDDFHAAGCRLSDHGLETIYAENAKLGDAARLFERTVRGDTLLPEEIVLYRSALLYEFAKMDAEKGWTQQFHLGVLRNNRSRLFAAVGPDAGGDSMADGSHAAAMNRFFDRLDMDGCLAKTIVYNNNPNDNAAFVTTLGNFQDGSVPGKMQFGSAWWHLDHIEGMEAQLKTLARLGVLSNFVGMLTDSRSFLSFPRHEYFRRILSNMLGREMKRGLLPDDIELVGGMLRNICYANAENYFGFPDV